MGNSFLKQNSIEGNVTLVEELALDSFEVCVTSCLHLYSTFRINHLLLIGILILRIACFRMPLHVRRCTRLHLHLCRSRAVMSILMTTLRISATTSTTPTSDVALSWNGLLAHAVMSTIHHLRLHTWLCPWFSVLNRSLGVINLFFGNRLKNHICG